MFYFKNLSQIVERHYFLFDRFLIVWFAEFRNLGYFFHPALVPDVNTETIFKD